MPDLRIEVLPSAHLIGVERPDESNAMIKEFLKRRLADSLCISLGYSLGFAVGVEK